MPVECILDEQSEEEIDIGTPSSTESPGHKCPSCDESFASLISLKEHTSLHCSQRRRRRRRSTSPPFVAACTTTTHLNTSGEPRREFCSSIRCFECRSLFPDRQSFMHHFTVTRCSLNRQRIEYTEEEQSILATHYRENNFPMPAEMSLLAKRLGVRYRQIMHWFQNRRSKERKQQRENKNPPVECVECKSTFVTEQNLKSHQAAVHSEAKESAVQEFPCTAPGCDASFTNEDLLVTHRLAHLPESEGNGMGSSRLTILGPKPQWKNFTVTVLEAHYSDNNFPEPMDIGYIARRLDVDPLHIHMWFKERRNQHIRKLEESGRVVVEGGLAVSSQRALSRVCNTCDAAFICQTDLDTHSEMHKSSWAQKCNMCSKEFSNVIALETHWIRHGVEFMGEAGEGTKQEATTTAATTTASTTTTTTTAAPPPSLPAPERMAKASFSGLQLKVLDGHYQQNHFPGAAEVWLVARRLGLRPRQVTHWFQNRRGRERRAHKVTTPASHPCLWCGAAFITPPALRRHRRHHRNTAARHACAQCPAVFLTAMLLETHSLLHQTSPHSRSTSPSQRPPDSSRDPLAVGQVRPGTLPAPSDTDESDGSEPELSIDLTATPAAEEGQGEAGTAGTRPAPSWHTPQPVMEEVDEEMAEMLRHAGIEVTDESLAGKESPASKDKAASNVGESGEVGELDEVRGQEFTLTEEEASASLEKDVICEQVFFDDHTDSEDDSEEEEPRLKIVSAYTISPSESDKARASEAQ
uniref:Uncharacterized protein n=1 Tax=Scylla olivacea TaxID=85551 RepID=A0A0P4W0Y7_SCYOL